MRAALAALVLLAASGAGAEESAQTPEIVEFSATSLGADALPAVIDEVETGELWLTRRAVLLRELPWRPGEAVSRERWELGLTRLWNTGLWSQIDARLERRGSTTVAVFAVEERITLNQIFRFSVLPGLFWLRVGVTDTNLLAQFQEIGVAYERFNDQQGGMLWWRQPRLFDRRLQLLVHLERLARPRFGFTLGRTLLRAELGGEVHDRLRVLGRLEVMEDAFLAPLAEFRNGERMPGASRALVGGVNVRLGLLKTVRLRQQAWSLELRPAVGATTDPRFPVFGQVFAELLAFQMLGERWNVGVRVQGAAMTDAPEQHRFFVGGLDLVRGLVDSAIRTTAYLLANAELRLVAFDSTWLALLPTLFVDGVVARAEAGGAAGALTAGLGCRFLVPRLVGTGLRLDLAVPLGRGLQVEPSIGIFQFF